jgi:hypothetical protein
MRTRLNLRYTYIAWLVPVKYEFKNMRKNILVAFVGRFVVVRQSQLRKTFVFQFSRPEDEAVLLSETSEHLSTTRYRNPTRHSASSGADITNTRRYTTNTGN